MRERSWKMRHCSGSQKITAPRQIGLCPRRGCVRDPLRRTESLSPLLPPEIGPKIQVEARVLIGRSIELSLLVSVTRTEAQTAKSEIAVVENASSARNRDQITPRNCVLAMAKSMMPQVCSVGRGKGQRTLSAVRCLIIGRDSLSGISAGRQWLRWRPGAACTLHPPSPRRLRRGGGNRLGCRA